MPTVREQLHNHAVALIALCVALASLAYNTWRNERTEQNRSIRMAAFEIIAKLGEFKRVVFLAQYDRDLIGGNPRAGWTHVIVIRDLSELVPEPVPTQAAVLQKVWDENWESLGGEDEVAADRIGSAVDALSEATLKVLRSLD
jgi:hypothetical protein